MAESTRTQKQEVGKLGEDVACRYLTQRGFRIIERNFLRKWGEIDIIASRNDLLHFIEVKTVSSVFGTDGSDSIDAYRPEENVHPRKLKRLARAVATYLAGRKDDPEWQFGVIAVLLDRGAKKARIRYLEDIVL
ncbi:MAG: YraN family protein [bacterium]|nr:YraN family protein [bacterium]